MIIVIEGFDQAGKKTQSKLLSDFLKTQNKKSTIFSFPDYTTPVGKEIKNFLGGQAQVCTTGDTLPSCSKQVGKITRHQKCTCKKPCCHNESLLSIKSSIWNSKRP